jgi:hypothetical protein
VSDGCQNRDRNKGIAKEEAKFFKPTVDVITVKRHVNFGSKVTRIMVVGEAGIIVLSRCVQGDTISI